jgi:quercetin dioxygenase-like cupin family protein
MSEMKIIRNSRAKGESTTLAGPANFTGATWVDTIHRDDDIFMAHVTFTPKARTFWHQHEKGQVLRVLVGSGWICDEGGKPQRLDVGDTVWCPPGTTHWHGADDSSLMVHLAITYGQTQWWDAVSEEEYRSKSNGDGRGDGLAHK